MKYFDNAMKYLRTAVSGLGALALGATLWGGAATSAQASEQPASFQKPTKRLVLTLSAPAKTSQDQAQEAAHYSHSSHRSHSSHSSHRSHYSSR